MKIRTIRDTRTARTGPDRRCMYKYEFRMEEREGEKRGGERRREGAKEEAPLRLPVGFFFILGFLRAAGLGTFGACV